MRATDLDDRLSIVASRLSPIAEGICRIDGLFPSNVLAVQTNRHGGSSSGVCEGFNLASHVGDDPASVAANRARLQQHLPCQLTWLEQVHGTDAVAVDSSTCAQPPSRADASITRSRDVACLVMTADCLPVLLARPGAGQVAAIHAGWRGLCAGIIESTLDCLMAMAPASEPEPPWCIWLGPCISGESFEVGADVRTAFLERDPLADACFTPVPGQASKWHASLQGLAMRRLLHWQSHARDIGPMPSFRVALDTTCTMRRQDLYYSYRRDRLTGRMASLIALC